MASPIPPLDDCEVLEKPLPNGVDWTTGTVLPKLSSDDLTLVAADSKDVRHRAESAAFGMADDDADPNDLSAAGWGVIFGPSIGDDIKKALGPLLAHRQTLAGPLYRDFPGAKAYKAGESVREWLKRQNVGFASVVPSRGVPLYLLIVASPQDIPFEFQYLLDTYWNVGRLYFDDENPATYERYARQVVAYETADRVPHRKHVAIFATANPGDRATGFFHNQVAKSLTGAIAGEVPIGQKQGFSIDALLGPNASKAQLCDLLTGKHASGPPALLISGSHGVFAGPEVEDRIGKIGAIVTQEWEPGDALSPESTFSAQDFAAIGGVDGLVHFFFACYSGGCPDFDTYKRVPDGSRKRLVENTMVARLPQTMLATGALGVIAHIDRAFACSFQTDRSAPQTQDIRNVLTRITKGFCLGHALDNFNQRWAILSAELSDLLRDRNDHPAEVPDDLLESCWLSRDDARNYLLLGDPAVRLRTEKMA
jgi:hypothetical protein